VDYQRPSSGSLYKKENIDIFFDLSQCRFCELGAIAKLILVVDRHITLGDRVFIALPTLGSTDKEKKSKEFWENNNKYNILSKREKANKFFQISGFVSAIKEASIRHRNPQVFFTENYQFESEKFNEQSFKESFSVIYEEQIIKDYKYNYLFPFKWIDCSDGISSFNEIGEEFGKILKNTERGIEAIDVKAIKNVVISELIKNVKEHSKKSYALIAIGLIDIKAYKNRDYDIENDYLEWIKNSGFSSQVEICFGDSGVGVLTKEYRKKYSNKNKATDDSKEQLKMAFQKWTSTKDDSPRRGTKGLYRIQRIVNKYNGIFHIDTFKHRGGFQKGGNLEEKYVYKRTGYDFNGTLVNIKLNPYKEIRAFKYKLKSEDEGIRKRWVSDKILIDEPLEECLNKIKKKIWSSDNLLLILDIKNFDDIGKKSQLEDILFEISRDSHPCAVVIYFINNDQLDNDSISNLLDSVNTRIIKGHGQDIFPEIVTDNAEDIHDPVLVIGSNNQAFWYGGSKELIAVLEESLDNYKKLDSLASFQKLNLSLKTKIQLYLENTARLVNLIDGGLVYNFINIDKHYEETIKQEVEAQEGRYCSPKLQISNYWLNIKDMLNKNEYGFALNLYLKFRQEIDLKDISKDYTYLIIDHGQHKKLAESFADLLGIQIKNIKDITNDLNFEIPRRSKLFAPNSNVIVLTTIISSSETARRLVKYIKRDFSFPKIILCLANFRKYNINSLQTWNEITDIISCYQYHQTEYSRKEKDSAYLKSKYDELNRTDFKIISPQFVEEKNKDIHPIRIDDKLLSLFTEKKLMHYNHIGVYNKRHFTFYVNKKKLLNLEESIIHNKIKDTIATWHKSLTIKDLHIYISESIHYKDSELIKSLENITTNINFFTKNDRSNINQANVVYIDFGILTGESINNFISNCHNVDNLLILIIFDQSTTTITNVYDRIAALSKIDPFDYSKSEKKTNFLISYLYKLPLSFYSSEDCPICEHQRALDTYKVDNEYLSAFSEDRQKRLNLTEDSVIYRLEYPVDFYYSEQDKEHELSSAITKEMYSLKILLENAKKYTTYRIKLFNYIYNIYSSKEHLVGNCNSSLFALLYYLAHEIHWFQIEPLIYRDFRIMVSEISRFIACHDRNELASQLTNTNKARTSPDKLAVRYKYAAISVLRSTHKLRYCESVYEIIISSLSDGKFSDNLLQNTLYHISSLIKNKYNRSEKYYKTIEENLKKVYDLEQLTIQQKMAIQKLLLDNSTALKSIQQPNPKNEVETFKKMKLDWEKEYSEIPSHPDPYDYLKHLNLKKHKSSFRELEDFPQDENIRQLLKKKTKTLPENWEMLRKTLNNKIYFYITSDLPLLTNSNFYNDNCGNLLDYYYFHRSTEKFSELILLISQNPKYYNFYKEEFNRLYKYFEDTFIKKASIPKSNYRDDSEFFDLLSQFPADLPNIIDIVFPQEEFPKKNKKENVSHCTVYFPINSLRKNLNQVRTNLKDRLKDGVELKDVNIKFQINKENNNKINLIIEYDGTHNKNDKPVHDGGLSKWDKELKQFGGNLNFDRPTPTNPNFILTIKFLTYGKE